MNGLFRWAESLRPAAAGGTWEEVEKGGSDRRFWRGAGAAAGLVAVVYGREKAENARYADCARFLRGQGVRVPEVVGDDPEVGFLLLEDAGTEDLWTHRGAPWEVRRDLYLRTLEQAVRLHGASLSAAEEAGVLQAPFDEALYRWEQDYFFEHFLAGEGGASWRERVPFEAQVAELAARPRVLLHRDLQSQNVMVRRGEVCLIDFQGMRAGLAGYDVASLLFDPYVELSGSERDELARAYAARAGRAEGEAWQAELRACARQRLMQALGAYGFLGRVKGRGHFLAHIPAAAERLADLCEAEEEWRPLAPAVRRAAER
jgi:aminoglycoside/choline kinase family phosphotransferase